MNIKTYIEIVDQVKAQVQHRDRVNHSVKSGGGVSDPDPAYLVDDNFAILEDESVNLLIEG